MKSIIVILDGIQDIGYPELDGKTPQEYGGGAAFDKITGESATARLATTPPGCQADTQVCMLTLLGISPEEMPGGRSYLEAMAEGIPLEKDDLVLRCNFVKIAPDGTIEDPCFWAPDDLAEALMAEVTGRLGSPLQKIGGYRCIQTVPGGRQWMAGLKTYPPHNHTGYKLAEVLPTGNELAERMAATTLELLEKYRPYTVLNWGQAIYEELPEFTSLYGMKGGVIAKTLIIEGIAKAMGMACPAVPGANGETDTNLIGKMEAALDLLQESDFVLLHVGGTDEATHHQNPVEKAEFIARIDKELLGPLLERVPAGTRMMLTCDHCALCSTAGHTEDPVDAWLWEKGRVHSGDLGLIPGTQAVSLLCEGSW